MIAKQRLQKLLFPIGSTQRIKLGYLKGQRIKVTENSDWASLVGRYEPGTHKAMAALISKGDTVYDIGANSGIHGMLMSKLVGEKGLVINFEPLPENFKELEENFRINDIKNYKTIQAAVSDSDGMARFRVGGHRKQGAIVNGNQDLVQTIEVRTIKLDTFLQQGNPRPRFIKMDIEGAELAALKGFARTIDEAQPIMIIELHEKRLDGEIGKFLIDHGYSIYRYDPPSGRKLTFVHVTDVTRLHPDPNGIWGTILCLPPGKNIDQYRFRQ